MKNIVGTENLIKRTPTTQSGRTSKYYPKQNVKTIMIPKSD